MRVPTIPWRLLRPVEQFLDECGDDVEDAVVTHSGLNPDCEAFSEVLYLHANAIEAALDIAPATSRTTSRRIYTVQSPYGQIGER